MDLNDVRAKSVIYFCLSAFKKLNNNDDKYDKSDDGITTMATCDTWGSHVCDIYEWSSYNTSLSMVIVESFHLLECHSV